MIDLTILGFALMTLVGLGFSAMFSGIETGIYTLNRVRLTVRAGRDERSAKILRDELQQPNRLLSTLLVGNNIANYAGSYGVAAILDHLGVAAGQAVIINSAVLIPLLFVFGEVLPKDLFRSHTDAWTYIAARPLRITRYVLTAVGLVPLVTAFGKYASALLRQASPGSLPARERIAQLMLEGVGAGVLSESQASLLDRTLAMRNRTVANEMTPWRRVVTLPADVSGPARQRVLASVRANERIIVVDSNAQPIGAADPLSLLLEPGKVARELMSGTVIVTSTTAVPKALRMLRSADATTGIVIDPRTKKPMGIVTVHDLVEPLTGGPTTRRQV
jgi:putative hemolysin